MADHPTGSSHKGNVSKHSNDPLITKVSDMKPSTIGPTPPAAAKDRSPEYEQNKFNRELATKRFIAPVTVPGAKG